MFKSIISEEPMHPGQNIRNYPNIYEHLTLCGNLSVVTSNHQN